MELALFAELGAQGLDYEEDVLQFDGGDCAADVRFVNDCLLLRGAVGGGIVAGGEGFAGRLALFVSREVKGGRNGSTVALLGCSLGGPSWTERGYWGFGAKRGTNDVGL